MSATIIDCKAFAQKQKQEARSIVYALPENRKPTLFVIQVGSDPASTTYINGKKRDCEECGIICKHVHMIDDGLSPFNRLRKAINMVKDNAQLQDSAIVQLPIPDTELYSEMIHEIIDELGDRLDCEGMSTTYLNDLYNPYAPLARWHTPCTAAGIFNLLESLNSFGKDFRGKTVLIISRSMIVGKPLSQMMVANDATVMIAHSQTTLKQLDDMISVADIIISATGEIGLIKPGYIKPGTICIDVGITKGEDGKLHGDFHPSCMDLDIQITTVPGGIGLITRSELMLHVAMKARDAINRAGSLDAHIVK